MTRNFWLPLYVFDEFDALGRRREGSESGVHHESVSSLLLSLMDGSKPGTACSSWPRRTVLT